jgi:hypothetical protein
MFGINLRHSVATLAVAAGLLAAAGSASAETSQSGVVAYNGHAGLGVTDGTSNTMAFGERTARDDARVFSGDAYDNEMGITESADGIIAVLIGL